MASFTFLSGVCFLSRASATPGRTGLRRMVMAKRAVRVFFMFFPLFGFGLCSLYIYL